MGGLRHLPGNIGGFGSDQVKNSLALDIGP